jgi:tocopherol O-methyltransferase
VSTIGRQPEAPEQRIGTVARFYDVLGQSYRQTSHSDHLHVGLFKSPDDDFEAAKVRTVDALTANLALTPSSRLIDVGCGVGAPALHVARTHGCTVIGITLSAEQVATGRALTEQAGLTERVRVFQADAHDIPFVAGNFDAVMALESMCHMNRARALAEVRRVLRPGGRIALCDWYARQPLTDDENALLRDIALTQVLLQDEYTQLIRQAGFGDVQVTDWSREIAPTYRHWARHNSAQTLLSSSERTRMSTDVSTQLTALATTKLGYLKIEATAREAV